MAEIRHTISGIVAESRRLTGVGSDFYTSASTVQIIDLKNKKMNLCRLSGGWHAFSNVNSGHKPFKRRER